MSRSFLSLPCLALILTSVAHPVAAQGPLNLRFEPPVIEQADVCLPVDRIPEVGSQIDDSTDDTKEQLTDEDRARFLRADIRDLLRDDPGRDFEYIVALIERRAEVDVRFSQADATLALIDLHLQTMRLAALSESGLVESLRGQADLLDQGQRLALARLYLDGTGVVQDVAFGQDLLRDTAFDGSAEALLEIARMAIDGTMIDAWDAPLDLTVSMAFGGVVGGLDAGICDRAERIAREYERGEIVAADAGLAFAWRRFAADMGDADAAWAVVQYHLNAPAATKDNEELNRYLAVAARLGRRPDPAEAETLRASGAVAPDALSTILGFNFSEETDGVSSIVPYLDLDVNVDAVEADEDGLYLDYLREVSRIPEAPAAVFSRLAREVLVRRGRWAGEAEAMELLEQAVARGDGDAMAQLAQMLMRYRDDPRRRDRAISLLMETVSQHGMAGSMAALDGLFRCQVNDAPRLAEANHWAQAYGASRAAQVQISATDLLSLDPYRDPETIARIQSQALTGQPNMIAAQVQRLEHLGRPDAALRFWAERMNSSRQALETFSEIEFELALSPDARDRAVEVFRRVFLNNGVTTALDLAIALTEHNSRDPAIAAEIVHLLTMAGNRGEGAAIRLLSRHQDRPAKEVFEEYAEIIEERGDFLALMFAFPFLTVDKRDDYADRAVSLMNCGTKDINELGDAWSFHGDGPLSQHWQRVGLAVAGGDVLSKLRLSDRQMAFYGTGRAPDAAAVAERRVADGDPAAVLEAFRLAANADFESYDPETALRHMRTLVAQRGDVAAVPVLRAWRAAPAAVQALIASQVDVEPLLARAANTGDPAAAYEYAALLRERAQTAADLTPALDWFVVAAKGGHVPAMVDVALIQGFGPQTLKQPQEALRWLNRAAELGDEQASVLAGLLRLEALE